MPFLLGTGVGLSPSPGAVQALVYVARTRTSAWSSAQTVWQLASPAAKTVEILRVQVGQEALGQVALLGVQLYRGGGAMTWTAPTTVSAVPVGAVGTAADSLITAWGTSPTDGAGPIPLLEDGWNVQATPYVYFPVPEERILVPAGSYLCLRFLGTVPSATYTISVVFREAEA